MDKIKIRQICFILACMLPLTKTIIYPPVLVHGVGHDLLWSAAINLVIEGLIVFSVMMLAKRTDKTLFELIENTLGKAAARIVYALFALFFLLAAVLPIMEQKSFVVSVFYENIPSFISFAPFFALSLFASIKGIKSIGRMADVLMPVFAVSLTVLLVLSVPEAKFGELLPVLTTPPRKLFGTSFSSLSWYTDCSFLLFFMGHFRYEKNSTIKVMSAYAIGAAVTLFFLAVFYAIFGDIALRQQYALAQISKYTTAFSSLGRVDFLFIYALTLVLVFYLMLPLVLCVHCIKKAVGCKALYPAVAVNAALLIFVMLFTRSFNALQQFMMQKMGAVFILFAYAAPLLAWLLKRGDKEKKDEQTVD